MSLEKKSVTCWLAPFFVLFLLCLFVCLFSFSRKFSSFLFFFLPSDRLVFDLYWVQQCVCYIGFISQHSLFGLVWENALKHPVILFCLLRFIFRQSWYSYSNSLVFCLSDVKCIDCKLIMWRKSKQTIIWYSLFFWFRRNNVLFSVGNVYCRFRSTVRDKVEEILPSFEELLVCMALTRLENKVSLAHWQLSALRSQEFDNPVLWHFSTLPPCTLQHSALQPYSVTVLYLIIQLCENSALSQSCSRTTHHSDNAVLWHFSSLATLHSTTQCSTTLWYDNPVVW